MHVNRASCCNVTRRQAVGFNIACSFNRGIWGKHFVKKNSGLVSGCAAAVLALGLTISATSVAQAAIITITVTGVVGSGASAVDTGDFLSTNQADLSGMAFSAQFVFNDAIPGADNYEFGPAANPTSTTLADNATNTPSVLQSMSISINGFTDSFGPEGGNLGASNTIFLVAGAGSYGKNFLGVVNVGYIDSSAPFNADYHTNATYDLSSATPFTFFATPSDLVFYSIPSLSGSPVEDVPLIAQQATVSSVGAPTPFSTFGVPEPSTWAMMILGIGMIGLTARRRTKALAAQA